MSSKSNMNSSSNRLINPTQLAIFSSIAIHLFLLKYAFPRLVLEEDHNLTIKETVPTIELTPEEQTRLPDLTPELNIPELNKTPLSEDLSPFALSPSIPNNPNLFPDLPPVPLPPPPNLTVPNVPPVQIPLPPLQSLPPITPPLPSLPPLPSTDVTLPPIGDTSSLPLPPPVPSAPVESPDKPASLPTTKAPNQTTPPEAKKPETKKPKVKTPTPSAPPKPKPSPTQIAAQRQQKLNQGIRKLSGSLQKNTADTTNEEARKNYVTWLSIIRAVKPEELTIQGTYPRDACIRRLEGASVYGALVNPQGEVTDLELIKGSEYPIFNQQASKDIELRKLANNTENIKPYHITVNFKYDPEICPSLTLPSLRRDNKSKQEVPKPVPPIPPVEDNDTSKPNTLTSPAENRDTFKPIPPVPPAEKAKPTKLSPLNPGAAQRKVK